MTKNKDSKRTSKKLLYLATITLGVLLITGIIYFVQYSSAEQSKKNVETLFRASSESNPAICEEIKGGINETINDNQDSYGFEAGVGAGVSVQFKKMNEQQAREYCRQNIQAAQKNNSNR